MCLISRGNVSRALETLFASEVTWSQEKKTPSILSNTRTSYPKIQFVYAIIPRQSTWIS